MAATITKRKNIFILLLVISLLILLAVGLDLINPKNNKIELNNKSNQRPNLTDSVSIFKKVINWQDSCSGAQQVVIKDFSVDTQGNIYIIETNDNEIIQLSPQGNVLKNLNNEDLKCKKIYAGSKEYQAYINANINIITSKNYLYLLRLDDSKEKMYKADINTGNFEEIWNSKMPGFEGSFAASWDVDDNDNLYFVIAHHPVLKEQRAAEITYHNAEQRLSKDILDKGPLDNSIAFWQITKNNLFRHDLSSFRTHDNSLYVYDLQNNFIRKFEPEHLKQEDDVFSWFGYDGNFYIIRKQPDNNFVLERTDTDNNVLARTQAKDYTRFNRNDVKIEIGFDGKVYIAYVDREQGLYGVDRYEF